MLRVCTEQDYKKYAELAYNLALDKTKSGYPTYCDGIKTQAMFFRRSEEAFSNDSEGILIFEYEGVVEGWVHYFWLPEERYLSTVSFNIAVHTEQALAEFVEFAQTNFGGYELYLGYPLENMQAIEFLMANGFECIEESNNNTAFIDRCIRAEADGEFIRITRDCFEYFRILHRMAEDDMYWNSDRIYEDLDNWIVFVCLRAGEPVGCVYCTVAGENWYEIFGIDMKAGVLDRDVFSGLLLRLLNEVKKLGGKYVTFFCNDEESKISGEVGFEQVGGYVCCKKTLSLG